jgi:hypothetical protein
MGMSIAVSANGAELNLHAVLNSNDSILCQIFKCRRSQPPLQGIGRFSKIIYDTESLASY